MAGFGEIYEPEKIVEVVDPEGKTDYVEQKDLPTKLAQGYTAKEGVEITTATGSRQIVSGEAATTALTAAGRARQTMGAEIETAREERREEERYDTLGNEVLAAITQMGNDLSFGLAQRVGYALGGDEDDWDYAEGEDPIELIMKYSPTGRMFGTIGAAVLPVGVGGKARLLAKAGKAAAGARTGSSALRAGQALLRYTPAGIAARGAQFAGSRLGGGLAARVIAGAVEGGALNAGLVLSDIVAHDKEFSAEALLSAAGTGALFGGAAVGAGALLSKATSKAAKAANPLFKSGSAPARALNAEIGSVMASADDVAWRAGKMMSYGGASKAARGLATELRAARSALDDALPSVRRTLGAGEGKLADIADDLLKLGEKERAAAINAFKSYTGSASKLGREMGVSFKVMDDAHLESVWGTASKKGSRLVDTAAAAEALGITNFVPDNSAANLLIQATAARAGGRALAGSKAGGAISKMLGKVDPGIGSIVGRVTGAVGRMTGKISSAVGSLGRKVASAKVYHAPVTAAILNGTKFYESKGRQTHKDHTDAYHARRDEIKAALANPKATATAIQKRLMDLSVADGTTAARVMRGAMQRLAFLDGKAPIPPRLAPFASKRWTPPDSEIDKFARYVHAAENPLEVFEAFEAGNISPEAAETLRVLYPRLFQEFQDQVMSNVETLRKTMSYDQRLALSIMLGVPIDETMEPSFILAMQLNHEKPTKPGPDHGAPNKPQPAFQNIDTEQAQTNAQSLEG